MIESGVYSFPIDPFVFMRYLMWLKDSAPSELRTVLEVVKWLEKFNQVEKGVAGNLMVLKLVDSVEKNRAKMKKIEPFPVKVLQHHMDARTKQTSFVWMREALIVGLCLRFTWRTETLREIKKCNIEFVRVGEQEFAKVKVYKSKTNQSGEEKVYWLDPASNAEYCLVSLLKEYLLHTSGKDWRKSSKPLFLGANGKKIETREVSLILQSMAKRAGVDYKFTSKSLRVGAVDWMVREGMTFESIRALGWAENSPALSAYIRVSQLAVAGGSDKMFSNRN